MKSIFSATVLLLTVCAARAQYIIRYDVARERQQYFLVKHEKDTVPVRLINLDKSPTVVLQLRNVPGSFRDTISYTTVTEPPEKVTNPWWPLAAGGTEASPLSEYLPLRNQQVPLFPGGELDVPKRKQEEMSATQAWAGYIQSFNRFSSAYAQWEKAWNFTDAGQALWKDLTAIRYSLQWPAEQARAAARTKTESLFPGSGQNPLLIRSQLLAATASVPEETIRFLYGELEASHAQLLLTSRSVSPFADSLYQDARQKALIVRTPPAPLMTPLELGNRISDLYRGILQDEYVRMVPLSVGKNTREAVIFLLPQMDSLTRAQLAWNGRDTIRRVVPIVKKSPMRFRNSFGMSFTSFAEQRWHYFVKNENGENRIARESADQFRPLVSSFLHFYSPRDRGFRWGGSIGAGLPVSAGDKNLQLMLGLSTFFGKNDPFCISAGLSGSQVKKLSRYRLGELVPVTELNEKTDFNEVYRIGFFLGISFYPGGINANN